MAPQTCIGKLTTMSTTLPPAPLAPIPTTAPADITILTPEWFERPTVVVASDLIGCLLCRRLDDGRVLRARITETEAYIGKIDSACHAHLGRCTARTEIMFHAGGVIYVYFTYGIHYMLNLVSSITGEPEAVLIRAAYMENPENELEANPKWLAGPGKLTKQMQIDKTLYGLPISPDSGLWIEHDGCQPPISVRPRIGIDYAGEAKDWLLRYIWTGHPSLSKK